MKERQRFKLLIIPDDGRRILRLSVPRWSLYGSLTFLALAVSALGAISGDYISLKRHFGEIQALHRQVDEQRALMDSLHRRLADVGREVSTWRMLQAKISEPLGTRELPAMQGPSHEGRNPAQSFSPGDRNALSREMDLLSAMVAEEGQSLHTLERYVARTRRMLAALPPRWFAATSLHSPSKDDGRDGSKE